MEKDKGREKVRDGGRGPLEIFFRFLHAAREAFFFAYTACQRARGTVLYC